MNTFCDLVYARSLRLIVLQLFCAPFSSAANERVFSQASLKLRPHRSRLSKSMLAQLVFRKCNNNLLWNGRLHDNTIYFVLLIAVVLLLVKFLQVSDSLWLSQNHKIRTTQCRLNYAKMSKPSLEKVSISLLQGLDLVSVSDVKINVSVSWKCGKVSASAHLGMKNKRLGLTPQGSFTSLHWYHQICIMNISFHSIQPWFKSSSSTKHNWLIDWLVF